MDHPHHFLSLGVLCSLDMQQQTQYLHQFVLHASLDAVDEAMWSTKELHLKVLLFLSCSG